MARNGSGVYSLPAGYLAVDGETILSAQHNTPLEDIAADLNAVRPQTAGGTGATSLGAALLTPTGGSEGELADFIGALNDSISAFGGSFDEFTESGTWTKPAGARIVLVEVIAGGGGGGRASPGIGHGGSGGEGFREVFRAADIPSSVTVTIGAGGAGKASTDGAGSAGGNSSFGTVLVARGGNGGVVGSGGFGFTGIPGQATLTSTGNPPANAFVFPQAGAGAGSGAGGSAIHGGAGGGANGGAGGTSVFGGDGGASSNAGTSTNGAVPGGGGGGTTSGTGGDGGAGRVRVWWW